MKYSIEIVDENGKHYERPHIIVIDSNTPTWSIGKSVRRVFQNVAEGFVQDLGLGNVDKIIRKKLLPPGMQEAIEEFDNPRLTKSKSVL